MLMKLFQVINPDNNDNPLARIINAQRKIQRDPVTFERAATYFPILLKRVVVSSNRTSKPVAMMECLRRN